MGRLKYGLKLSEVKLSGKNYYCKVDKRTIREFGGDLALALWYSALKDYRRRFRPDELGFTRISSKMIEDEIGLYRQKVYRLNRKLEEMGYIVVDKAARGGRRFIGIKFLK